jgi:hypothetical protein
MGELMPQTADDFQSRMKKRIRASIGELLSDAELQKLINRSMNEIFFEPRKAPRTTTWGPDKPDAAPLMHEIVKELIEPSVKQCVSNYIAEHADEIKALVSTALDEGFARSVIRGVDSLFKNQLMDLSMGVQNQISELTKPGGM